MKSQAEIVASLPAAQRKALINGLTDEQCAELQHDWDFYGRPSQFAPPGDWLTWLILAGRGFGKTRTGAEWVRQEVCAKRASRIALVAETQKDLEEVMVFGKSGIASVFPPHQKPNITRKPIRIEFHTGAIGLGYNATEPDQLRGPEFDCAFCDELAKWAYARDTWDMLQFTLRHGKHPRVLVTTTPRPIPVLKDILGDPATVVTRGDTFENAANLSPSFLDQIRKRYEGTRLGRQEIFAEILDDTPGALWNRAMLDKLRVPTAPEMRRVVVAVDPSGTSGEDDGDSVGIVVAGLGLDGRGYVLADRTCSLSPAGWGRRVVEAYHQFGCDRIVAERNFGGAMVEAVIRTADRSVAYREVTASRGKVQRAEPVAALFEQGRVSIVGSFPDLEDQLCGFTADGYVGEGSPDRADAMVWAITELMVKRAAPEAASGVFVRR